MTQATATIEVLPYVDQYLGAWAMHEPYAMGLFERARQLDLHLHMAGPAPSAARRAADEATYEVTSEGVGVIRLQGTMMKQVPSMTKGTSTVLARRQIREAVAREDIASLLLHIESPGGTVAGTEDLANDVAWAAKRKPVIAFIEDLGASAAYWVASQATKVIAANESTLIGSIGVFTVIYDYSGAAAMEGIKAHVIRAGQFKGMGTAGTEITPDQLAEMQRVISGINTAFMQGVSVGRKFDAKTVESLADGRVHSAAEAKQLRLVDAVQSLDATLAELSTGRSSKRKAMSKENTAIEATAELINPVASYSELKAALPGASSDFICKMLDGKKTVAEATKEFMAEQQKQIEAANKRAADAEAEAAAKVKKPGVDPLAGEQSQDGLATDALAAFEAAVDAEMKRTGKPRHVAHQNVCRKNPDLRKAYVAAYNEQHRA